MTEDDETLDRTVTIDLLAILNNSIRVKMGASTKTSSSPVEVILARNIGVNMPPAVTNVNS